MLRDKDYVTTRDDLVLNVIGYHHPPGRTLASLKYVQRTKWTSGYRKALHFLNANYPQYVDDFISVPHVSVRERFTPREGLQKLLDADGLSWLQRRAVELSESMSRFFEIPLGQFGVTDSLLWGPGRETSDVDLVVLGTSAATRVLDRLPDLYRLDDFSRYDVGRFTRPDNVPRSGFTATCQRRLNKGRFKGTRFSLRAVRQFNEIGESRRDEVVGPMEVAGTVTDNRESLFFPCVYRLEGQVEVVSYSTVYEAVYRVGDAVVVRGVLERGDKDRIVVGSLASHMPSMQLRS